MECGRSCGSVCPVLIFGYFKHNLFFKKVFSVQVIELTWNLGLVLIDCKCDSLFLDSVFSSVYLFALFSALTYCPDFSSFMLSFFFAMPKGTWYLSCPIRDQICSPCVGRLDS